jgi:dienelactone hydrolase
VLARVGNGFTDCKQAPGCTIEVLDFNSPASLASVPIAFDPAGPAPTFPTLTVAPGGPLAARSGAIVMGHGFHPHASVFLEQCRIEAGLPRECDGFGAGSIQADESGAFVAGTLVTAVIAGPEGSEIDCRVVTCAVVADPFDGYPGIGAIDFGRPVRSPGRYLAPVFDAVDMTEGIAYRSTTNSRGQAVELKLDVYRPAGDTATKRPVVMWMFGGYFGSGDRVQLREMAQAMARRGYVSVSIDYRTRPEIFSGEHGCVPVGGTCLDPTQLAPAITDARDDARAAMVWLHEHAAEYGIEPRAITSAGWSAGAITSLNLAHDASGARPADSIPAAAISLSGILAALPQAGDPPTLMLGGNRDSLLPLGAQVGGCSSILTVGGSCDFVAYAGVRPAPEADDCVTWTVACTYVVGRDAEHGFFFSDRPDVINHISTFLAAKVLKPLGLLPRDSEQHHPHHHRPHHHPRHDDDHEHHDDQGHSGDARD